MNGNRGFQVFGGSVAIGAAAVGTRARAVAGGDLPALVAALRTAVDDHRGELSEPARAVAAELLAKATAPAPDPTILSGLGAALAELAAAVEPVTAAARNLVTAART
ncbi:hypothetical protein [Actinokineospora sp. NPDC004072]